MSKKSEESRKQEIDLFIDNIIEKSMVVIMMLAGCFAC